MLYSGATLGKFIPQHVWRIDATITGEHQMQEFQSQPLASSTYAQGVLLHQYVDEEKSMPRAYVHVLCSSFDFFFMRRVERISPMYNLKDTKFVSTVKFCSSQD